jgi:hypothetical protein
MDLARLINPLHPRNYRRWQLEVTIGNIRYPLRAIITNVEYPQEEISVREVGERNYYTMPFTRRSGRLIATTDRLQDLEVVREVWDFANRSERDLFDRFATDRPVGNMMSRNQTVVLTSDRFRMTFGQCILISYELNPLADSFRETEYRAGFEWLYHTLLVEENGQEVPGFRVSVDRETVEHFRSEWLQEWPRPRQNPGEEFLWDPMRPVTDPPRPLVANRPPITSWNPPIETDRSGKFEDWQTLGF